MKTCYNVTHEAVYEECIFTTEKSGPTSSEERNTFNACLWPDTGRDTKVIIHSSQLQRLFWFNWTSKHIWVKNKQQY